MAVRNSKLHWQIMTTIRFMLQKIITDFDINSISLYRDNGLPYIQKNCKN